MVRVSIILVLVLLLSIVYASDLMSFAANVKCYEGNNNLKSLK